MANSILTISMITREALRVLENNLTFTKGVNRQYDDQFAVKGAKIGSTLNIRKPARYVGRSGPTLSVESQTETYVPLTLDTQRGVDVQFTSADLLLSMDDFSERYLKPAMASISNHIDADGLALQKYIYNSVGTPGVTPATLSTYLDSQALMDEGAAPRDGLRSVVIGTRANATIVNALTTLFNPTSVISEQYERGNMGMAIGSKWSMDQNVGVQTIGAYGTSNPLVDGASQTGASVLTKSWASSAAAVMAIGDIFTMAGVYAVNPQSRASTGQLQQFVVTATPVNDGSGNARIYISPSITTSGQFQTVTASPADAAVIKVYGALPATTSYQNVATPSNLAYHRDAFVLGSADLELPRGVDMAARVSDPHTGLSVRMVRAYDVVNDLFVCRTDVLYGWAVLYPQLACRIQG